LKNGIKKESTGKSPLNLVFFSRLGRSLEKAGVACAELDANQIRQKLNAKLPDIKEKIGGLKELTVETLYQFTADCIQYMQHKGGIYHSELKLYMEQGGSSYLFGNMQFYMKNVSQKARLPIFIQTGGKGGIFEQLISPTQKRTWFQERVKKVCGVEVPGIESRANELLEWLFDTLETIGVLVTHDTGQKKYWGINPEFLHVQLDPDNYSCDICGHSIVSKNAINAKFCLQKDCYGSYSKTEQKESFFAKLYKKGDLVRLFAGEHTGLLERETREALEQRFINRTHPADENLLSCTPTLELGIDLSDLSTVVLCSVPPAQTGFLQRIGRAGRETGNAFVTTVANGKPHDLFFYQEPLEMISGHVDSPSCYMQAPEILKRQLIAFCMDRWIESGDRRDTIPFKIRELLSDWKKKKEEKKKFPFNFLHELNLNRKPWFKAFENVFVSTVGQNVIDELEQFYYGNDSESKSLEYRVLNGLNELYAEREGRSKRIKKIKDKITDLEKRPQDDTTKEQLDELNGDKSLLIGINATINNKQVLNYFTDEGLLPNYAFPEQGVTLKSIIVSNVEGKWHEKAYEYIRPAESAIRDFAPMSVFYAEAKSVTIDQIDVDSSPIEKWRVCDECSNMELVTELNENTRENCPQCKSSAWSDIGQVIEMLRLRQVHAKSTPRKSITLDDADNRQASYFQTGMFVQAKDENVQNAWAIDPKHETPFGFEFLSKVELREINFGVPSEGSEGVTAASVDYNSNGFIICSECGKVAEKARSRKDNALTIKHTHYCKQYSKKEEIIKDSAFDNKQNNRIKAVFLYRDFVSEAIRIHVPVFVIDTRGAFQSLSAALYLGLKKHFGGNPGHLRITRMEEPDHENPDIRHNYLVLFDGVPGGTGVLKQLMSKPSEMISVLEKALKTLKQCECNSDPSKDGCYRCVYGFRERHDKENTSRNRATELLEMILKHKDDIVKIKNLRSGISGSIGSELEKMFIDALAYNQTSEESPSIKATTYNSDAAWEYKTGNNEWLIVSQEEISLPSINTFSVADYVFIPQGKNRLQKKIAVFLDGYKWHGGKIDEPDKAGQDIRKRQAILHTDRYWVFTLSWDDVKSAFELIGKQKPSTTNMPISDKIKAWIKKDFSTINRMQGKITDNRERYGQFQNLWKNSPWATFNNFLSNIGYGENTGEFVWQHWISSAVRAISEKHDVSSAEWETENTRFFSSTDQSIAKGEYLGSVDPFAKIQYSTVHDEEPCIGVFSGTKINTKTTYSHLRLYDDENTRRLNSYKYWWNEFYKWMNLLQFASINLDTENGAITCKPTFFSSLVLPENEWTNLPETKAESEDMGTQESPNEWREVFEALVDEDYANLVGFFKEIISKKNIPVPEIGAEDLHGEVNTALLHWNKEKIALVYPGEPLSKWESKEWKCLTLDSLKTNPSIFTNLFGDK